MDKMEPSKFCNLFFYEQTLQYAMFDKPITFGLGTPVTPGFQREGLSKRDLVISCFTFFSLGTFWSTLLTREKSPGLILLLQSPDLI